MFNVTFETSFRRCLIPKERPRKNIFGFAQNQWRTTLERRFYKHTPSTRWNSKIRRHKFSKKRDAKFKRNGIKPQTSIDCTEDTVVRKTRTWHFRRKTKAENRKSNVVANRSSKPLNSAESSLLSGGLIFCPNPPKINVRELDEDLDQFARRLRNKEYFHSKKETSEDLSTDESDIKEVIDIPRFVKKSNWIPKLSKNTRLESVIHLIRSDIKHNVDVHVRRPTT